MATLMLMSLFGGLLQTSSIGIEVVILENEKGISVNIAVQPYLSEFDLNNPWLVRQIKKDANMS